MSEIEAHVNTLVAKAAKADDSGDAMRFAQAALNATNAALGWANINTPPQSRYTDKTGKPLV